jgi:hypothetical protein
MGVANMASHYGLRNGILKCLFNCAHCYGPNNQSPLSAGDPVNGFDLVCSLVLQLLNPHYDAI